MKKLLGDEHVIRIVVISWLCIAGILALVFAIGQFPWLPLYPILALITAVVVILLARWNYEE